MAYGADGSNSPINSVLNTVQSMADFRGRSRRSEMGYFIILWVFIGVIPIIGGFARIVMFLAIPALLVRRMHDCNFTGWLALILLLPSAIIMIPLTSVPATMRDELAWLPLMSMLAALGFLAGAIFWPGTVGANSYGADPRLDENWDFGTEGTSDNDDVE